MINTLAESDTLQIFHNLDLWFLGFVVFLSSALINRSWSFWKVMWEEYSRQISGTSYRSCRFIWILLLRKDNLEPLRMHSVGVINDLNSFSPLFQAVNLQYKKGSSSTPWTSSFHSLQKMIELLKSHGGLSYVSFEFLCDIVLIFTVYEKINAKFKNFHLFQKESV